MVRRSIRSLLAATVVLGFAVGCPSSSSKSIVIVSPTADQAFTAADDVAPTISGVQIDVTVRANGFASGDLIHLTVNGDAATGMDRTWTGADVVFNDVTLDAGENVIAVSGGGAQATVTVQLTGTACPALSFVRPAASARIETRDDADGNPDNGFQYDVQVATDAADGTTVELLVAGVSAGTATATSGRADFAAVKLLDAYPAAGAATNVTLRAQTSDACTATISVQVVRSVTCPTFTFVEPTDGQVFGAADDENHDLSDGFQKTVVVSTSGADGTAVDLLVGGSLVGTTTVSGTVVRFDSVDLTDGSDVLRVQTSADCGDEITVTVDTGAPSVTIDAPTGGYLNAADDVDAATAGLQVDFEVTSDAGDGRPCMLIVDGVEGGAPTGDLAGTHVRFAAIALSEGDHTARVKCTNAVGNVGFSSTATYTVDSIVPTCAITAPADGTWFNDGDDALAAVDGTQVQVTVHATDAPTATTVARCGYEPLDPDGTVTLDGSGNGSGYVTLTGAGNEVCCAVQDAAGNAGEGRVTLNLETEMPQFEIRRPDASTTLILAVDDEGPSDTLCQYTVEVGCSNVGQPVTLYVNGGAKAATPTCTASADALGGTATWTSTSLPQGSVTLRAEGDNIGHLHGVSPDKTVTVDTEPPVLAVTYPACGIVITPADDNSGSIAGIQYRVVVQTTDSPVTLNVTDAGGTPISGSPYSASLTPPGAAIFPSVTVVPSGSTFGTAYVSATATDVHGQVGTSTPSPCTIEVRDVPQVQITSPAPGALLGPANDCDPSAAGFQLGVTVTTNITSGSVELFVGGVSAGTLAYTGTPLVFCVDAPQGTNIPIRADGTDVRGTGSAQILVTIDSLPPDTGVTDLAATVFNRRAGQIDLNWTAPADAGGGSISGYQTRCTTGATSPVAFDWTTATPYSFTGTAGAPGTAQTQRVTGFRITKYVACMVRPVDAVGSIGPLGNVAEVQLPFLTQEIAGPDTTATMGSDIEPAGDVNGDTIPDFVVGSESGSQVFVFFGNSSGVPTSVGTRITGPAGSYFGASVAGIGDFDGDTIGDIAIGAYGAGSYKGRAYIYYGRSGTWPSALTVGDASVTLVMDDPASTQDNLAFLGWNVSPAGDFDGDTKADLLVGAPGWNGFVGSALLLFGRSIPAGTTLTVPGDFATGFAGDLWFLAAAANGQFGTSCAAGYRLNGDMYDDVALSSPFSSDGGRVFVSMGRARASMTGLQSVSTYDEQLVSPRAGTTIGFGSKIAFVDPTADGRPDLMVHLNQHPGATGYYGGALLYVNDGSGTYPSTSVVSFVDDLSGNADDYFSDTIASGVFTGSSANSRIDSDTVPDVLFGGAQYGTEGGAGALFFGRTFAGTTNESAADATFHAPTGDTSSQAGVAFVGDVTGDGWPDIAVGQSQAGGGQGRVVIVY